MNGCEICGYVCDTPLGSYCTLTNEPVETTDCHYDDVEEQSQLYEQLMRDMR